MSERSGARLLVDQLEALGTEIVFTLPGEGFVNVLDAIRDGPIRVVVCRHEGGAAFMAEAYGKLTGRPGVALVARGPGAAHASIGVHTAFQDSTPMLLLVGQVPTAHRGREAFQEVEFEEMFRPLAKGAKEASRPEQLPGLVADAFTIATSARPGPVVVSLPSDVLAATTDADIAAEHQERIEPWLRATSRR